MRWPFKKLVAEFSWWPEQEQRADSRELWAAPCLGRSLPSHQGGRSRAIQLPVLVTVPTIRVSEAEPQQPRRPALTRGHQAHRYVLRCRELRWEQQHDLEDGFGNHEIAPGKKRIWFHPQKWPQGRCICRADRHKEEPQEVSWQCRTWPCWSKGGGRAVNARARQ